jgi:hypothetical protein
MVDAMSIFLYFLLDLFPGGSIQTKKVILDMPPTTNRTLCTPCSNTVAGLVSTE